MSDEQHTNPKTPSVFIIDDDEFLINMYATKFEKEGFEVNTKTSPHDALDAFREGAHPDVVLLDIIMPQMTGLEMLQTLQDENLATESDIVMLTNQGGAESIDTAKKYGAKGYIVKATSIPSEVVEKVKYIINT